MTNETLKTEYQDLTQHEIAALKYEYNLADAHTHQSQSPSQEEIIQRLPEIWHEAENRKQHELEQRFIHEFFRVQKQEGALHPDNALLVYASSIAMVITANYLMKKKMSVALLEPCFDNIHDILSHMSVPMEPLKEGWLHDTSTIYETLCNNVQADALFIVDPNNPTGFTLFAKTHGEEAYKELIRFAKDKNKLLIFDYCFAPFIPVNEDTGLFDIYQLLEESKVSYIAYEDTGKTWPIQDTKAAIIKCSTDIYEEIYNIHTSYLLNVSPFILNLLTQYILDSEKDNFASVYTLLDRNREIAKRELNGDLLEFQEPSCKVSVAWFKIKNPAITATYLQRVVLETGVYILPGTYFFWSNPEQGESFIRIALARNTDMFEPAVKLIRQVIDTL